ncbi:MAG: hypothetical protein WA900_07515 [Casimicrobiaceae bacterium]
MTSTPAIILKGSEDMWAELPFPPEPQLHLPRFFFSNAMNCRTVMTPSEGLTTSNSFRALSPIAPIALVIGPARG